MPECALCKKTANLRTSHIIPAFAFRWLRKSSATSYMRFSRAPNKRVQDGIKLTLLCEECEQLTSAWERVFATAVFNPWVTDSGMNIEYGEWMLKFCVSISWRILTYLRLQRQDEHLSDLQIKECDEALERWSGFLLGIDPHPGRFEQHLVLFDAIETHTMPAMPTNMNRYMLRGIEMDLAHGETTTFTYAKIGPFALFGVVQPFETRLRGTKIHVREGTLGPTRYVLPQSIWEYWITRANRHASITDRISATQRAKIDAEVNANLERLATSGTFEAMRHDAKLSGRKFCGIRT